MPNSRSSVPAVALAGCLVSWCPALAQGCGPTRLKVVESVTLDMPAAETWRLVGNFQDLAWDAEVAGARGRGGNEPDKAVRTLTLTGGATLGESLYKYDADTMSYAYHIDSVDLARLPVQNASATIEVVPESSGAKSVVRWKAVFYRNLSPGEGAPDQADAAAAKAMRDHLRAGLAGLKSIAAARRAEPRT